VKIGNIFMCTEVNKSLKKRTTVGGRTQLHFFIYLSDESDRSIGPRCTSFVHIQVYVDIVLGKAGSPPDSRSTVMA
jgi:hypothetical protein